MIFCLFCSVLTAHTQVNYVFQHLTSKDGLSSNFIQSIFQDSKGFYWVGTLSGLQKFDSYTFSKPLAAGKNLLQSSTVLESRNGILWISNQTSTYRYSRTDERIIPIVPRGDKPKMNLRVIEDSAGNIWMLNDLMLYKYDSLSGTLINWLKLPPSDPTMVSGIIAYNKEADIIWIQNGITLYEVAPAKRAIIKEEKMPYQAACIWADGNSYLWISFWTAYLCRYNLITGKKDWFTAKIDNKNTSGYAVVSCFLKDKTGRLWMGTDGGGLWYFDVLKNKLLPLKTDNLSSESFHYNEIVYSIINDNSGSIWVGSDRGINIFNPTYQSFYTIGNTDPLTKNYSSSTFQKPFETSTGDILANNNYGGWLIYDNQLNIKRNFPISITQKSSGINKKGNMVYCFAEDKKGKIWIGYSGGILGIYDPVTGNVKYKAVPEFRNFSVCSIACDTSGNMWFSIWATSNNLAKWDPWKNRLTVYNDSLLLNRLQGRSAIMVTKQNAIWVQTFGNGIYRFDPEKERITEIYREDEPPYHIPNSIQGISLLNDSIIAIASFANGFFLYNHFTREMVPLSTNEGLPSNIAKGIAKDRHGNLWVAMINDLVRINPQTKKIISFDEEDGVINKSFTYGFTTLHDGRLIVPTNTGLLFFHPDSIKIQEPPPDVLITGLKIFDKPILLDSTLAANQNKLQLTYDQDFITIDYVSISYLSRKTIRYFYRLEGLQKEWVNAGTQRFSSYTHLDPGKYTFMVRCENRDGIPSNTITYLRIIISPPWWLTWWAYTMYVILSFLLVNYFIQYRIVELKKTQVAEIRAIVATQEEERKRISRDLHDDVGTKLSALKLIISSLYQKASHINNEAIRLIAKSSEQYITETMQDVRQLLANLSPVVLEEFGYTTAVERLVNKINETNLIQFTLVVFGMKKRLPKDYELILYRITQELINNVLKHADAKNVSLQIGQRDNKIILMIEDDGKGFDANARQDGYGIQNLNTRTKLLHGSINIDSKPGNGTSVLIEIPYREI